MKEVGRLASRCCGCQCSLLTGLTEPETNRQTLNISSRSEFKQVCDCTSLLWGLLVVNIHLLVGRPLRDQVLVAPAEEEMG